MPKSRHLTRGARPRLSVGTPVAEEIECADGNERIDFGRNGIAVAWNIRGGRARREQSSRPRGGEGTSAGVQEYPQQP